MLALLTGLIFQTRFDISNLKLIFGALAANGG